MMHILLLLLSLFHSHVTNYTRMVDHVSASVVRITVQKEEGQGVCTGFVIAPQRVLTAGHCAGNQIQVDGVEATALKVDEASDLLLLKSNTKKTPLEFNDVIVWRFEPLTALGYGLGWKSLVVLHVSVVVVTQVPAEGFPAGIIVQTEYVHGMSGGPVVDEGGKIVGIVQAGSEGLGFGVGTQLIRAFLLGTD